MCVFCVSLQLQDGNVLDDLLAALVEPDVIMNDPRDDIDMAVVQPEGDTVQSEDSPMHAASVIDEPFCGDRCCHEVDMHAMRYCDFQMHVVSMIALCLYMHCLFQIANAGCTCY